MWKPLVQSNAINYFTIPVELWAFLLQKIWTNKSEHLPLWSYGLAREVMPEISFQLQTKNKVIQVILTNFDVKYNLQLCKVKLLA